jgi:hypothetical protein
MKRTNWFPLGILVSLALLSFGCAATTTVVPSADYGADGPRIESAGGRATPWMNSLAYDPGWDATLTLWVVDDNGRASSSIAIGPIVVRGKSVVPKAHW